MRILKFWHRLHAELAALQAAWRADREWREPIETPGDVPLARPWREAEG